MTKLRTQQTRAPRGTFDMLASVALALSFVAPALRPIEAGAWTRSAWARMDYAIDKAGTLGKDIHALEDKCAAGEMDACVMLDQLSGYAQTLNDMNKRVGKPPDAPSLEEPETNYIFCGDEACDVEAMEAIKNFDIEKVKPGTVRAALVKLFKSYDSKATGVLSLDAFYQKWSEDTSWQNTLSAGPSDWGARQARAGARRIKRLFGGKPDNTLTMAEFVGVLESEYDKRLARGGLSLSRAISEVESNMPQRAIYAELYGNE